MSAPITNGLTDATPRAAPVAVGDVIAGRYRVERVLGEGGMGVVVAATHVELGKLFAVKLMRAEVAANPESAERFLREARAAADLESEHVARVHDFGRRSNGTPFMTMEYLEGVDLARMLEGGPLPLADVALYALQTCDALAEAHARGIVHRDLKPANLFLTQGRDGSAKVKVLDFGISKVTSAEADALKTATGASMGSPVYMSPEQVRASRDVDSRADIWAMGVVLYQLATGALPFNAAQLHQIFAMVLESAPYPPSRWRFGLPADFDRIVLRCLQKDPAARYRSVVELARELSVFVPESGPALAERVARVSRFSRPSAPPDRGSRPSAPSRESHDSWRIPPSRQSSPAAFAPTQIALTTAAPGAVDGMRREDASQPRATSRRRGLAIVLVGLVAGTGAAIGAMSQRASSGTELPSASRATDVAPAPASAVLAPQPSSEAKAPNEGAEPLPATPTVTPASAAPIPSASASASAPLKAPPAKRPLTLSQPTSGPKPPPRK